MSYEAVVLDMDGVIFDSERPWLIAWAKLGEKYGFGAAEAEAAVRACAGTTAEETRRVLRERFGPEFPLEEYEREAACLVDDICPGGVPPVKPGAEDLLSALKTRGVRLALATSASRERAERELAAAGLLGYFEQLVCGDAVAEGKPAPDLYLTACRLLGVAPREAVAIEDSRSGLQSAAAAGLAVILVPDLEEPEEEMGRLAWVVLSDLEEARIWLEYELRPCAGSHCDLTGPGK